MMEMMMVMIMMMVKAALLKQLKIIIYHIIYYDYGDDDNDGDDEDDNGESDDHDEDENDDGNDNDDGEGSSPETFKRLSYIIMLMKIIISINIIHNNQVLYSYNIGFGSAQLMIFSPMELFSDQKNPLAVYISGPMPSLALSPIQALSTQPSANPRQP